MDAFDQTWVIGNVEALRRARGDKLAPCCRVIANIADMEGYKARRALIQAGAPEALVAAVNEALREDPVREDVISVACKAIELLAKNAYPSLPPSNGAPCAMVQVVSNPFVGLSIKACACRAIVRLTGPKCAAALVVAGAREALVAALNDAIQASDTRLLAAACGALLRLSVNFIEIGSGAPTALVSAVRESARLNDADALA